MKTFIAFLVFIYTTLSLSSQIITTNKKKMVGVVDSLGKELIPFKFTKIEESSFLVDKYNELTNDPNQQDKLYTTYDGKRQGLYSLKRGELIPSIYERIDYLYDNGFRVEGYLVHNYGKQGFYHPTGKEIAPCEFELIECINHNSDYFKIMVGRKSGKWYSWHYGQWEQTIFEPIDYSIGYEFILGKNGYVRDYITYDVYDIASKNKLATNIRESIEISNDFYTLFCENGKCGAKSKSDGAIILNPTYELMQFEADNRSNIFVSQNGYFFKIDLKTNSKRLIINDQK